MERPMARGTCWVRAKAAHRRDSATEAVPDNTPSFSEVKRLKIWLSCYILSGKKQIQQSGQLRPQETGIKTWENKQLIHSKGLGPNNWRSYKDPITSFDNGAAKDLSSFQIRKKQRCIKDVAYVSSPS